MSQHQSHSIPGMLFDIRRRTGLDWESVGFLLGTDGRTVFGWAQGTAPDADETNFIELLHSSLVFIDRGSHEGNASLLDGDWGGQKIASLLAHGDFETVRDAVGKGEGRASDRWSKSLPRKPSGRQDHWTDRVAAHDDGERDGPDFIPSKVIRKIRLKLAPRNVPSTD